MASYLFGKGRGHILGVATKVDLIADNIKCLLVDSADDTPIQDTDEFHSDVAGAGIVATSGNMASKTGVLGAFDAADLTFSSVTGDSVEYLYGYKDTGTSGTSPLIWKIDDYSGQPITPNGTNITFQWPAAGIFIL